MLLKETYHLNNPTKKSLTSTTSLGTARNRDKSQSQRDTRIISRCTRYLPRLWILTSYSDLQRNPLTTFVQEGCRGLLRPYVKRTTNHERRRVHAQWLRKIHFLPVVKGRGSPGTRPTSPAYVSLRPTEVLVSIFFHMQLRCRAFLRRSADRNDFVSLSVSGQHMAETLRFY